MCEEKEKVAISPYVFAGIRTIDLPKSFYDSFKTPIVIYKINHVIDGIAKYVKVSEEQLKSRCRKREYCDARNIYCSILRYKLDYSLLTIGRSYNRDHTTAINSIRNHDNFYGSDNKYKALYDMVDRYVEIMSASEEENKL